MYDVDSTSVRTADSIVAPALAMAERFDPVELYHLEGRAPVLIICDHAGRRIPRYLGNLGLPEHELSRHIGWDIGAADATRRLARLLDAPAVLCHSSRLVIDPNRGPGTPTSIPTISDGTFVPGNQNLDPAEEQRRVQQCFIPYHRAVARQIARLRRRVGIPVIISMHSLTPVMKRTWRPWQVAVLSEDDRRLADPVLEALGRDPTLCVGDNVPYSGNYPVGYSVPFHAMRPGFPHIAFELRQDLIDTRERAENWADLLAQVLREPLADATLYERYGRQRRPGDAVDAAVADARSRRGVSAG